MFKTIIFFLLCITLQRSYGQEQNHKEIFFSLSIYPASFPLGNYAFNLNYNATQNAGAFRGWGCDFSIYYTPSKLLVLGGEMGFVRHKADITGLYYDIAPYTYNLNRLVSPNSDTSYLLLSKAWMQIPVLGKFGVIVSKKKFDFILMGGLGVMLSVTPQQQLVETIPIGLVQSKYIATAALFSPRVYFLFAYNFSFSFNYRFIPMTSIGICSELTGTLKNYEPYVTRPSYGYDNYILYANLGLNIRFYLQYIKGSSLPKLKG